VPTRRALLFALAYLPLLPARATAQGDPNHSPQDLLRFVYGHYVQKSFEPDIEFDWGAPPLVDQLFEPALARAIRRGIPGGAENLDFDPFVDAQDFDITSYDFKIEQQTVNQARIIARFKNLGDQKAVRYELVRLPSGWRVQDISWGRDRDTLRRLLGLH
jgi:hypothetical protein